MKNDCVKNHEGNDQKTRCMTACDEVIASGPGMSIMFLLLILHTKAAAFP